MRLWIQRCYRPTIDIIHPPTYSTLHSVYEHAINLRVGDRLICLQPAETPLTPVSLITELSVAEFTRFSRMRLNIGSEVLLEGANIHIPCPCADGKQIIFDGSRAAVADPPSLELNCSNNDVKKNDTHTITLFYNVKKLLESDCTGGIRAAIYETEAKLDLVGLKQRQILRKGLVAARAANCEGLAGILGGLVGLGIGLTPSGDDFLCGVLAALSIEDAAGELKRYLAETIKKKAYETGEISRTFLYLATEGRFSESVCRFFRDDTENAFKLFKLTGSSSGIDTLCGIGYGLQLNLMLKGTARYNGEGIFWNMTS